MPQADTHPLYQHRSLNQNTKNRRIASQLSLGCEAKLNPSLGVELETGFPTYEATL